MPRAFVRPSSTIRTAVIIAASVALLLPLPPRCLSCSTGTLDCNHCQATHSTTAPPAHRSCCDRHAHSGRAPAHSGCSTTVRPNVCGCKLQAPDRTYTTADRQTDAADFVALLPAPQQLFTSDSAGIHRAIDSHGDLPPPIPHRILHCSWII